MGLETFFELLLDDEHGSVGEGVRLTARAWTAMLEVSPSDRTPLATEEVCPQHYAMTALGFATVMRPSSLRPLRRSGPQADVL